MTSHRPQPVILLCAPAHPEVLCSEFERYERDYRVRCVGSAAEAAAVLRALVADGSAPVALLVTESQLPDAPTFAALHEWRTIVPTARRLVAAHWERFRLDADALRAGMTSGKFDAYLLMPRGPPATRSSTPPSPKCSRTGVRRWPSPRSTRSRSSPHRSIR